MQKGRVAAAAGLAVAVAAAVFAWRQPRDGADAGPRLAMQAARPPIVLYLIDTLRADRLGAWGHAGSTSPVLDALARDSVVFEQAYGAAPWTLPSVASLFTSSHACEHGVVRYLQAINPAVPTLAERLGDLGYDTGSYYSNIHSGGVGALDRGFRLAEERDAEDNDRSSDVAAWLADAGGKPWFLFLHTMEPHGWFSAAPRYHDKGRHVAIDDRETLRAIWFRHNELRSWDWARGQTPGTTDNRAEQREIARFLATQRSDINALYDASVRHADENLGKVIEALKANGAWEDTLFIVLSDHGEELGEHGGWFHDHSVYEEQLRVPLLIRFPQGQYAGTRVQTPVSLVDVMPTLLDYLGAQDRCEGCRGRSLLPLVAGNRTSPDPGSDYIPAMRINELMYSADVQARRGEVNVALRRDRWKGIWNADRGQLELYDLATDSGERVDLGRRETEVAAGMSSTARSWLARCGQAGRGATAVRSMDEQSKARLRALGYFQ
ncbi:MAG: sulfatase [Gammaproteobacteria bacterium]|nr:sulfatase [Gammaproteobacteria bacterium]